MKLEEIIPKRTELKLSSSKKVYHLRPVSLEDEIWMHEQYGDELQKIIGEMRTKEVCRIAYRLLEEKEDFLEKNVTLVDERGKKVTEKRGGIELLYCMMLGLDDKMAVLRALLAAIGISRPMLDKVIAEEEKKRARIAATGKSFSTSSPTSTAGLPNISSRARSKKSSGAVARSSKE